MTIVQTHTGAVPRTKGVVGNPIVSQPYSMSFGEFNFHVQPMAVMLQSAEGGGDKCGQARYRKTAGFFAVCLSSGVVLGGILALCGAGSARIFFGWRGGR